MDGDGMSRTQRGHLASALNGSSAGVRNVLLFVVMLVTFVMESELTKASTSYTAMTLDDDLTRFLVRRNDAELSTTLHNIVRRNVLAIRCLIH